MRETDPEWKKKDKMQRPTQKPICNGGVNFWTIEGTKGTDSGGVVTFTMDFSQARGSGSAERLTADGLPDTHRDGTYTDGRIEFTWVPTCDTVLRGQIKWIKQSPSA